MFSCVAVDCGFPSMPRDGILQVVQTRKGQTLYKDQIQFKCSSKYYTLEGPGNSRLCPPLISKIPLRNIAGAFVFVSMIFFMPADTYTCDADGEWVSVGGKSELPKCIEGTLLNSSLILYWPTFLPVC